MHKTKLFQYTIYIFFKFYILVTKHVILFYHHTTMLNQLIYTMSLESRTPRYLLNTYYVLGSVPRNFKLLI